MKYTLNLEKMISEFKNIREEGNDEKFIKTDGEQYLYNTILRSYTPNGLYIGDIDLEAFDEDDIISFIDKKSDIMQKKFFGTFCIAKEFMNTAPTVLMKKGFF